MALQPLSHSVTQSGWVAEWLRQPLCQSGWVASGCSSQSAAATQPLCQRGWTSHSATLPERLDQPLSHSGRAADAATQPLSEWLSGWSSHSYQSGWVAEWLVQPLWQSGWVAASISRAVLHIHSWTMKNNHDIHHHENSPWKNTII